MSATTSDTEDLHRLGSALIDDLLDDLPLDRCLLLPIHQAMWGVMTLPRVTPEAALEAVVSSYESQAAAGLIAMSTAREAAQVNARFVRFLVVGCGIRDVTAVDEAAVRQFIWAPHRSRDGLEQPNGRTTDHRRWATSRFFRELIQLGVVTHDPVANIRTVRGLAVSARPLTDREEIAGRRHSGRTRRDTRGPAAWAIGRATGYSTEATLVEPADLREDRMRLWLPGGHGRAARWARLEEWDVEILLRRIDHLGVRRDERVSIIYEGDGDLDSRQASGSDALYEIFMRAGFGGDRRVKPSSLPAWAGRRIFELTGDLSEVRDCLGVRTLDDAARITEAPLGRTDLPPAHRQQSTATNVTGGQAE